MTATATPAPPAAEGRPRPPARESSNRSVMSAWRFWPAQLVMVAIAFCTIYPVVFLVLTSFKTREDYTTNKLGLPREWSLDNFRSVWTTANFDDFAVNSLIIVSVSVALVVVVSSLAGYAFGVLRPRGGEVGLIVVVALIMIPPSVLLIPSVSVLQTLGLRNSVFGLIFVYVAQQAPFATYLMASAFRTMPPELFAAAKVDGAGGFRRFWSIALPLARPSVLATVVLIFVFLWNELLFALVILVEPDNRTVMVGLGLLRGQFGVPGPQLATGAVFAMVPVLVIYILFQRHLVSGLTAGSLK